MRITQKIRNDVLSKQNKFTMRSRRERSTFSLARPHATYNECDSEIVFVSITMFNLDEFYLLSGIDAENIFFVGK